MQYIDSFLSYLKYEKRSSRHTLIAYEADLRQFGQYMEDMGIDDERGIKTRFIRDWVVTLHYNNLKPRSIHRKVASLRAYFKYLLREEIMSSSPVEGVVLPKIPKNLPDFVKEKEMDFLLDHVLFSDDYTGIRDRTIIDLFYGTGMRLSELVALRDSDFDLKSGLVKVLGKRNKERLVPVNRSTIHSVNEYISVRNKTFGAEKFPAFFLTDKGKAVYHKLVYRIVNKHLKSVTTLAKKSPHILRHTYATILLNRGADINAIKELLGHANLNATQIYTHNTFEQLSSIYNQAHPRA
ncbi:MAG: integrase [Anaerophaga sp.]|uniref:tyrosine-type recombinase/integrase n=1 Tax=Anaerophaga thermohalophila TaxID=177400 RepID=UPI000237CDCE|nr:tyrosine-type recombinase/integrase [Anaerophaga thermohalophila]MBZ4676013.1 integrase [Anaerophaga sp.]MDI3520510.1 integrase/recombinase XerC [Anaerophaga sp.]MDK2840907.1 integrase/recombinase XerC [Anaerophaga sp.]MDN5289769.1 integrase/recombinase XerC [Anaerophaga sp.]